MLDIPVSITGDNIVLSFLYRVSSPKIELFVWKSVAGNLHQATFTVATGGEWNSVYVPVESDVEAVWLVAKKRVITMTVEYILLNSLKLAEANNVPRGICVTSFRRPRLYK